MVRAAVRHAGSVREVIKQYRWDTRGGGGGMQRATWRGEKKTGKIGELSEDRAVRFPEWGPPALVAKGKSYLA